MRTAFTGLSQRPVTSRRPSSSPPKSSLGSASTALAIVSLVLAGLGTVAVYKLASWAGDQPQTSHGGPVGVQWVLPALAAVVTIIIVAILELIGLILGIIAIVVDRGDDRYVPRIAIVGIFLNLLIPGSLAILWYAARM